MTTPPPPDPAARPVRPGLVIGGLIVGVLVCWLWIAVVLFAAFAVSYSESASDPVGIAIAALAFVPLVVAVFLLVRPRTRQMGAGFLMGLAIGMIAGGGVCVSLYVPTWV